MADGFHLGKLGDGGELVLDPDDLTTHAVIVGMTGSGKTGLGIVLLEEALAKGIPALILDPKGDMGNLALTFPDLSPASFRPWIDESAARDAGQTPDEYAQKTAELWQSGLERSGIGPDRIKALRDAAEVTLYTPGSEAGVPLNVIGSLKAPTLSWETDEETIRDEIEGTVSSLLGLVGIEADPIGSREHVLLSNLLEHNWRAGTDLDLGALIGQIQKPPLRKLGVFEVDAFMPPADRNELAIKLNALVASPSFAAWGRGPALDPAVLLRTEDGRPRAAVIYLAHLSDQERQLVVTLVLSRLITWMHGQSGTSELRGLVYLDEVMGFAPPTAMPPSKKPILTLMKQARAFGIGMVIATQNPVDLDYKAMANAGSWFIGRLQTERDKERVLEGLRSAAGGVDVAALDTAIGGLEQRQFLLQSAHRDKPELFSTRWAMSFLRGPLTKEQIATLTPESAQPAEDDEPSSRPRARSPTTRARSRRRSRTGSRSAGSTRRRPGRPRSAPTRPGSACRPSSPPASTSASTTRRPISTRPRNGRPSTARSTPASTSTARRPSTTTTATCAPSRPTAAPTCSPASRSTRRPSSATPPARSSGA